MMSRHARDVVDSLPAQGAHAPLGAETGRSLVLRTGRRLSKASSLRLLAAQQEA
jgi:hypothetical protein